MSRFFAISDNSFCKRIRARAGAAGRGQWGPAGRSAKLALGRSPCTADEAPRLTQRAASAAPTHSLTAWQRAREARNSGTERSKRNVEHGSRASSVVEFRDEAIHEI